jgi:hypothetical protein
MHTPRKLVGNGGGPALAETLRLNIIVTSLELWENDLGEGGGQALAETLRLNTSLTSLDLRDWSGSGNLFRPSPGRIGGGAGWFLQKFNSIFNAVGKEEEEGGRGTLSATARSAGDQRRRGRRRRLCPASIRDFLLDF